MGMGRQEVLSLKVLSLKWTRCLLTLLALVGFLLLPKSVTAHALLTRSLPAAGTAVANSPATVEMWFSEPLEAAFSSSRVVDTQGKEIVTGGTIVDASDPKHMTLHLNRLSPGVYTIVYRSLSQADGHEWIGSFPLTILNADGTQPTGMQAGEALQTPETALLPSPLKVTSRWLSLLGAILLVGLLLVRRIASGLFEPADDSADNLQKAADKAQIKAALQHSSRRGSAVSLAALLAGSLLQLAVMQQTFAGNGVLRELLLRTYAGNLLATRFMLVLLLLATLSLLRSYRVQQVLCLLISVAILTTFPLVSHAAAVTGSGWAILVDFVHLAAAALWLGGLVLLALLLWQLRSQITPSILRSLHPLIERFSALATVSIFVLVCSGVFSTLVQLRPLSLLWSSQYGWVLLGKLLLMAVALVIALGNRRWLSRPQGATQPQDSSQLFPRQLWSETFVGLALLVAVAVLVQTPPPQQPTPLPSQSYYETILTADDLNIHLQILPNQVGNNQYVAHLYPANSSDAGIGAGIGEVQLVRISFAHESGELGQASLDLTSQGNGLFRGEGAYLNRAGAWDVSIYVRRRGMDDLLTKTRVEVPAPGAEVAAIRSPWQNPLPAQPAGLLVAGVLTCLLMALLIWRQVKPAKR